MPTVLDAITTASPVVGEERFLIHDVSWAFYVAFCEEIGERPLRLTYSDGMLEIMITKAPHEFYKKMLAKLVEVELSRSLVSRVRILAAMGVKELWRYNGKQLRFGALEDDGTYHDRDTSLAFPFLRPSDLEPYLPIDDDTDETTRIRRFRDWLRELGPVRGD